MGVGPEVSVPHFISEQTQKKLRDRRKEPHLEPQLFLWKGPGAWLFLSSKLAEVPVSYTKRRWRTARPLGCHI